jgi:hypothetical protein
MRLGGWITMLLGMMIFLEFLAIPTGLSVVLQNFGVSINPNTAELVDADIENSTFFGWIFGNTGVLILLIGGGAVIVGLFAKSYDTSLIVLPILVSIATLFASTSWAIINHAQSLGQGWITALVATIFIPLGVGFIWACVDYFAGR